MAEIPPAVRRWLDRYPVDDLPKGSAGAAVMIVLREGIQDVEVLLIERSVRDGDLASGQVALPGGHVDASDRTMRATALRELSEEVGIGESGLLGVARLVGTEEAALFGLSVAVYAAALGPSGGPVAANPNEVAHVFWLPVRALRRVERVERATRLGVREVPAIVHDGHVLWGFTLKVLNRFFADPSSTPRESPDSKRTNARPKEIRPRPDSPRNRRNPGGKAVPRHRRGSSSKSSRNPQKSSAQGL